MEQRANRVLNAVQQWLDMEKENAPFFSNRQWTSTDKLEHYSRILKMFAGTTSIAEKLTLNEVRKDVKAMESELYPSKLNPVRLGLQFARFLNGLQRNQSWEKETALLKQQLLPQLPQAGFSGAMNKVEKQLDLGYRNFEVREHASLNDNRIAHVTFRYEPDLNGRTSLASVQVVMPSIKSQEKEVRFSYNPAEVGMLNIHQLRNLASGRIVGNALHEDRYQLAPSTYIELLNGELQLVTAKVKISDQVKELPFKETRQQDQLRVVLNNLKMGDQVEVTHAYTNERFFLQLSRGSHMIEVLNNNGNNVPLKVISEAATLAKVKQELAETKSQQKQHPVIGRDKSTGQSNQQVAL